jgi:hypothetical protein
MPEKVTGRALPMPGYTIPASPGPVRGGSSGLFNSPAHGSDTEVIKGLKAEIHDLRKEKASAAELMLRYIRVCVCVFCGCRSL